MHLTNADQGDFDAFEQVLFELLMLLELNLGRLHSTLLVPVTTAAVFLSTEPVNATPRRFL